MTWFESKTKLGAILAGGSLILSALAGLVYGTLDLGTGIPLIATYLGGILAVFGFRDAFAKTAPVSAPKV